jgi:hypothetical protein
MVPFRRKKGFILFLVKAVLLKDLFFEENRFNSFKSVNNSTVHDFETQIVLLLKSTDIRGVATADYVLNYVFA